MSEFKPTPEQIDVFRVVEEEVAYGNALADDQFTIRQSHVARELADLGYLDCLGDVFEITAEGQAAFADSRPAITALVWAALRQRSRGPRATRRSLGKKGTPNNGRRSSQSRV